MQEQIVSKEDPNPKGLVILIYRVTLQVAAPSIVSLFRGAHKLSERQHAVVCCARAYFTPPFYYRCRSCESIIKRSFQSYISCDWSSIRSDGKRERGLSRV